MGLGDHKSVEVLRRQARYPACLVQMLNLGVGCPPLATQRRQAQEVGGWDGLLAQTPSIRCSSAIRSMRTSRSLFLGLFALSRALACAIGSFSTSLKSFSQAKSPATRLTLALSNRAVQVLSPIKGPSQSGRYRTRVSVGT